MQPNRREFMKVAAAAGVSLALPAGATAEGVAGAVSELGMEFTRGVGVYPGAPGEYWGPELVAAGAAYRNLALRRPAFHSSSYDYNLTAQLVTDGIAGTTPPEWTAVSVDGGVLTVDDRELLFDHFLMTTLDVSGEQKTLELHLGGGLAAPRVDRVRLLVQVPDRVQLDALTFTVATSMDGHTWQVEGSTGAGAPQMAAGYGPEFGRGWHLVSPSVSVSRQIGARFYRLAMTCAPEGHLGSSMQWKLAQLELYDGASRVEVGGPYRFTSAWKSLGAATEWVSVDLGAACVFDRVALHWIAAAAEGKVQVSDDAAAWRDVAAVYGADSVEEIRLVRPARGRYVRLLLTRPATGEGYALSEFEVYGRGGLVARRKAAAQVDADGRLELAGGAWRVERASAETTSGEAMSQPGRARDKGIVATVPGTVLTSYLNAGALPDPNFGSQQLFLSDSYFYADFWYTTEFAGPQVQAGELLWLEFAGVNWKAEVFLNGERLGRIDGGFQRGRFNVTGKVRAGHANALAVRVEKNATPGSVKRKTLNEVGKNGGALGADNPTYHASAGWDWIPTIRGRNTGIWGPVTLSQTGAVTLESPTVSTVLREGGSAEVSVAVTLTNHRETSVEGTVRGRFGEVEFVLPVPLKPGEVRRVPFEPLHLRQPKLWWPAGYGEPHLYAVQLEFAAKGGRVWPGLKFQAGVRQMTYSEEGGALRILINGRRLIPKGGNWGFSESMLRYRAREYDAALRYHKEMHFNIVRNWVGQIGDDAFYEACDRHGLLVWQDFWLANPGDGPEPDDDALFLAGARDVVDRIRMHACIGLYCGRNEGYPPEPLEQGLRKLLAEMHPEIHYIPSSADGVVSGRGPYHALLPEAYFGAEDAKFHSEIGAPAIPTIESVRAMMPTDSLWPMGADWGAHDFCMHGAQDGHGFVQLIESAYGGADDAKEWTELAQFINYDTYRAMFEAQGRHRMGVLLWMSHPCWPSFVWQTYDYSLEPTAAYFGCRKACEPLHIQWNAATDEVEIVNASAGPRRGLRAAIEIFDERGRSLARQQATVDAVEDSLVVGMKIAYPKMAEGVHVLRLTLEDGHAEVSNNTYLRSSAAGDYRAIRAWQKANVTANTSVEQLQGRWKLTTTLQNSPDRVALMVRLKVVGERSGDRILPAVYSDNYLTLLPGESRRVLTEVEIADARGERPVMIVEHFR